MIQKDIDLFLIKKARYFNGVDIFNVNKRLESSDETKVKKLSLLKLRNPNVMIFISILFGKFGIDRFLIHDKKNGILKLLSGLILPLIFYYSTPYLTKEQANIVYYANIIINIYSIIFTLMDIFKIKKLTKISNFNELKNFLTYL